MRSSPLLRFSLSLCLVAGLGAIAPTVSAQATGELRRFAVVVGANDGGPDRVELRYAASDAESVARVLAELGGVADSDTWVLRDPTPQSIDSAFAEVRERLRSARRAGRRVELVVYYSGHSDERGLLLGQERYGYRDLRKTIEAMPADVNIAVLDSCSSGAFTRTKGGTRRPPFLIDASARVSGYAFLSSSSADEAAQESDKIAASFFTYYFVSGLRGAADSNHDQKVTLSEAYRFAFDETVQRTEGTRAGPQHPAYDMHLAGTGDVVMTDLRQTSARLVLTPAISGRVFVRDADGRLVAELSKLPGRPVMLGLDSGTYEIAWLFENRLARTRLSLRRGATRRLAPGNFTVADREATVSRGGPPGAREVPVVPVRFAFVPGVSSATWFSGDALFSLNMLGGVGGGVRGLELGGLANINRGDVRGVQAAGLANVVVGRAGGLQMAGLGNSVSDAATGVQMGGLGNVVGSDFLGIQFGGLGNVARGSATGLQAGGIGNVTTEDFYGIQLGGIANVTTENFTGLQLGGIANVNGASTRGVQVGLINVGGAMSGAQIGLVNVATRAKGLQLGLVNVAEDVAGAPIGLVNWVENGRRRLEVWSSDTAFTHVGAKLGARHVYTVLAAASDADEFHFGAGLGVHIPVPVGYLDLDLLAYDTFARDFGGGENDFLSKVRLAYGVEIVGDIAVFAGVIANFSYATDREGENPSFFGAKTFTSGTNTYRLSPGAFAGVSF